ncbi:DUF3618 domain-containing protein [Modestobacter sp. L9-4]|jgi:hypothetical protein|uniref:DUF3618 domain-containing protein n=1 Tax=Modestobacter sp. L9-4 TaxID=2851567 RepID=UPI001C75F6B5|nr:DUF3618 domain-containing protein [Modestobacter sp. L9-4]QXG75696.1 DUF3618 domain-containing protein [Modestobacter sp. L9-4]
MSKPTPADIQAEIDAARERLGGTVDQLAARLDVPARTRARLTETALRTRDTAVETYRESPPTVLGAAAAVVSAVVGLVVWRRKR